jgi:ADP-ribose pyrophosphatase
VTEPPAADWELLSEEVLLATRRHVVRRRYRYADGAEGDFEVLVGPQVVSVLCLTADQQVVLARQYRPGPGDWLDEVPGGGIEPGEDPAAAAARELLEETGYAGDVRPIGKQWSGAYTTTLKHVFAVTGAVQVADPVPEESGLCVPVLMTLEEFRAHLRSGPLTDVGPAYAALDALGLL